MNQRLLRALVPILLILLSASLTGCGDRPPSPPPGCADAPRPIVFVHGFLGGGDNFAPTVLRFASNGYCSDYLRTYDWNTLSFDMEANTADLDAFVNQVLDETGAEQIDLVGHSMGGRLCHQYLQDHAERVAHYVHAASFCDLTFPEAPPVLVLSSDEDTILGTCTIDGADNQDVDGADHLQIVTLPETFAALYRFFNAGQAPDTTRVVAETPVILSGKVLDIGMNTAGAGASVSVYPLDASSGERLEAAPAARFTAAEDGRWGPFEADPATYYEFEVTQAGTRPFHYYRQPFLRSTALVYLRRLPESNLLLNNMLGDIRYDDASSTIVFFNAHQALYAGRDSATLDGVDLVTPEMAPPPPDEASTIAIFIQDFDGDGQTDGGPVPGPTADIPFFQGYDAFIDASSRRSVMLTFNGAALHVPTWKGDSEGAILVVFDYGQDGL